eukprot:CAMPEP_0184301558 /NCGR_PEP_ID=MMETSP1049-20130417/11732_1 /TAXON_ID=77928 /ORGANISM="Proteomonas sulcata, Strain CCMP704" /LENGTH=388 /DNA_ID=CAMNT_0026612589 /DNA_START=195 /DNA_END=1362 /DNA_ORIENTATION=+
MSLASQAGLASSVAFLSSLVKGTNSTPARSWNQAKGWETLFHFDPIVDIGKLGGSVSERTVIGKELDAACRDCGFFYIRGHGVDETLLKSVRELTREWFDLPDNQKQLIQVGEHTKFRGWQPLGVNVTRYEGGFQRDWHESIDLYREVQVANSTDPRELRTINPWPKQIPLLEPALKAYVTAMLRLGRHLMRGIAIGLELSPTVFEDANKIDESYWCMRLINYPPLADAAEGIWVSILVYACHFAEEELSDTDFHRAASEPFGISCGEHTDYGLLTIINQDPGVSALQVQNASGQWISAEPVPGALVCNIGDMLQVFTNGLYKPTLHRVSNLSSASRRISVPFFFEPNYDALISPLPEVCQTMQQPPLFDERVYYHHLQGKLYNNLEY